MPKRTYSQNVAAESARLRGLRREYSNARKVSKLMSEGRRQYNLSIEMAEEFNNLVDDETREAFWEREDVERAIKSVNARAMVDKLKAAIWKWKQENGESDA